MGLLVLLVLAVGWAPYVNSSALGSLSVNFYERTCPMVEDKIREVLAEKMNNIPKPVITLPATLRLFFHDCFVEGCDGSIMITSTAENKAERDAEINRSLAGDGYDIVDRAKKVLETACPGVVSCADILAILARDVVHMMKGPHWELEKGRRDGRMSVAANAEVQMPRAESNLIDLVHRFQSKGLTTVDLVTLSGAHNVGNSHCKEFATRIFGRFHSIHNQDPTLNSTLRKNLMNSCPIPNIDADVSMALHQQTPNEFDNLYYRNLRHQMGLLTSDQVLFSGGNDLSRKLVYRYAEDERLFFSAFAASMHTLGRIGVKTGMDGEIRKDCTRFN